MDLFLEDQTNSSFHCRTSIKSVKQSLGSKNLLLEEFLPKRAKEAYPLRVLHNQLLVLEEDGC